MLIIKLAIGCTHCFFFLLLLIEVPLIKLHFNNKFSVNGLFFEQIKKLVTHFRFVKWARSRGDERMLHRFGVEVEVVFHNRLPVGHVDTNGVSLLDFLQSAAKH